MAEYTQDLSLFNRLKRLFSNDVVIRNVSTGGGDHQLKVIDINQIQKSGKYQTNSLVDRFSRLYIYNNKNIFSPTLNYQTLRIVTFQDYEAMDTDAIVSSALDVLADECLLKNDRGEILNIISSDENIKRSLENLFYDVLNIDFNLWSWVRGMLKYGDFFLKLEISEKFGVFNALPYSPYHMTRIEGQDPNNPTKVVFQLDPDGLAAAQDPNYLPKGEGGAVTLENYEVAHFRLLTDSNYLPYGRSYLEPARKIFKQMTLCLPGDAIIWVPGGYKKLDEIQKGDSIYSFDYDTNSFVETKVTGKIPTGNKPTYKVWTKHRCIEATGNHPLMLADGSYKAIEDLTPNDRIVLGKDLKLQDKNLLPEFKLADDRVKARIPANKVDVFSTLRKRCLICGKELKANNHKHISSHGLTTEEYFDKFDINRHELGLFSRGRLWIPYARAKHCCELYGFDIKDLQLSTSGNSKSYVNPEDIERTSKMFIRFFGFMLGDGWTDNQSLCFSLGNRLDKSQKFVDYLKNDLHISVGVREEGTTRAYASCSSQWLKQLFDQLGWKTGCKNKEMPAWVWNLPRDYKVEFLKGFSDADGTYDPGSERWSLCGINKSLLENSYVLAQQIGLTTSNFSIHRGGYEGYWGNIVNDLYGFGYSEKDYHAVRTENGVPVEKIIKIEKVSDSKPVYDLSVESCLKNFVANGVVVHNCEDAAMIHRIMRAPEKRIFYINVGQIPPNEVENFMQKTINNMKKTPYVGKDGQYNLRFNMQNMMEDFYIPVRGGDTSTRVETTPGLSYDGMEDIKYYQNKLFSALKIPRAYLGYEENLCVVPETEIPLMNGTTKTVAELIQDHEAGVQNYVYSLDENTGLIVPGKVTWAGYTRKNADLVRVWLDNEQYLDTTPDHLFMTRDGEWIEAQDLKEGTSLMPLYLGSDKRGYTTVYQPFTQTYRPVHRIVAEHYDNNLSGSDRVVHHIDCNKLNNYPENLDCSMNFWQHRAFHAAKDKHLHPNEYRSPNRDKVNCIDLNEFYAVATTAKNFYEIMEYFNISRNTFNKFLREHNIDKHELVWDVMLGAQKESNFIRNFTKRRNHKVVKVEFLTERRDTCDLRVENYHNFATAAGVFIHNSGKATLSAEDIRFARTIERIQRIIESELTKIALVHLYAQGFTGESLTNFDLKLTTPSVIFEQEKVALLKEKVDLARQMQDLDMFPSDYIYENIFGISEEEYQEMRDLVREDAKNSFRLSQIESEGNDPALSGKSYGTPHDLASMYGRRSTPAPKGAAPGDVPAGYAEKPREWGQPGPQGGRPRKRASFYGTQDNPAGGADPTGRMNMHQPYESDAEYVMEGRNVNINFPKAKEEQMQEIKSEVAKVEMLQENRFSKIDSMLAGLGEKLNLKKQQKSESETNELDLSGISMLNDETFVE